MADQYIMALNKTKIRLLSKPDTVFFSSLAFSLKHRFDESVPTAGTDGEYIYYNPNFFMKLSEDERVFLLVHETMHCAYMHMFRAKQLNMDQRKANIAADHVINLQLIERGFKMPQDGLADIKYKGMSMEEIYKLLPDNPPPPPMEDLLEPGQGDSKADPVTIENAIQDALIRASVQSKMAGEKPGNIPAEIQIFLNGLLNPKLPWKVILQRFMQEVSKKDYSWKKPNRRFFPQYHLPTLYSTSSIKVAVAVDTSGSVSNEEFKQFISDIHSILKTVEPEHIDFIQFDTTIKSVDRIKTVNDFRKVKFHGRGGTNITPVMEWAIQNKPKVLLVFSDGYFPLPDDYPNCHLFWVIHNNENWSCPNGKVVHYTLET